LIFKSGFDYKRNPSHTLDASGIVIYSQVFDVFEGAAQGSTFAVVSAASKHPASAIGFSLTYSLSTVIGA